MKPFFVKLHSLLGKIPRFFPRYTLRFVEKNAEGKKEKGVHYVLAYGEYRPISLTAQEILKSRKLKETLDPDELLDFYFKYLKETEKANLYSMVEISREGIVVLKNAKEELRLNVDEFCTKPWIIEKTKPIDIYKIVSHAYLNIGRRIEQELQQHDGNKKGKLLKLIK